MLNPKPHDQPASQAAPKRSPANYSARCAHTKTNETTLAAKPHFPRGNELGKAKKLKESEGKDDGRMHSLLLSSLLQERVSFRCREDRNRVVVQEVDSMGRFEICRVV